MWSSPRIYFRVNLIHTLYKRLCNVSTLLKPILFAVYTNLLYSGKDIKELCCVVSIQLDKLCKWFQVNKLSLNTPKTNCMVFINKSCDDTYSVCMNGLHLSRVFATKLVGVHMDSNKLDWNDDDDDHHHYAAVVSRGWANASACCLQITMSCAVLCHIVSLQYLSRSSLHRLAGLPCRIFLSYGLQEVTREVHRLIIVTL